MPNLATWAAVALVLVALLWFVWPTPWQWRRDGIRVLRVNRLTRRESVTRVLGGASRAPPRRPVRWWQTQVGRVFLWGYLALWGAMAATIVAGFHWWRFTR